MKPKTIRTQCPGCSTVIQLPFMEHSVEQYTRTCRKCRRKWRVLVRPMPTNIADLWLHVSTWKEIRA